jgi:hypothetical protein
MGRSLLKYILLCMGPSFLKYHAVSERRHEEANYPVEQQKDNNLLAARDFYQWQ